MKQIKTFNNKNVASIDTTLKYDSFLLNFLVSECNTNFSSCIYKLNERPEKDHCSIKEKAK